MSSASRPRRPHLERTEPLRSFGGLFVATESPSAHEPAGDDVANGVGIGYRLIEEYLRQGQHVAQSIWPEPPALGATPASGIAPERLLEHTTQLAGLWFEQMRSAWPAPAPASAEHQPGGFTYVAPEANAAHFPAAQSRAAQPRAAQPPATESPGAAATTSSGASAPIVVLHVDAQKPVEVSLTLVANCPRRELIVFEPRMARGDGPRLQHVEASWLDAERVRLSLHVPEAQPAGSYAGVVVDAVSNQPLGTLSVRVLAR